MARKEESPDSTWTDLLGVQSPETHVVDGTIQQEPSCGSLYASGACRPEDSP